MIVNSHVQGVKIKILNKKQEWNVLIGRVKVHFVKYQTTTKTAVTS